MVFYVCLFVCLTLLIGRPVRAHILVLMGPALKQCRVNDQTRVVNITCNLIPSAIHVVCLR